VRIVAFISLLAGASLAAAPALALDASEQTLDLRGFKAIEIGGAYELDVVVGEEYSIVLSGPAEEMERVEARVDNEALMLNLKKRSRIDQRHNRENVRAVITMPALERLSVSGVVEGDISGVQSDAFRLDLSGVGNVTIAGRCGALTAHVSGVGELNAQGLACKKASVRVSGVGEASAYASDEASAEVSGMGEINIYGSPNKVEKRGGFLADISVH
jgi:hypothetical protein